MQDIPHRRLFTIEEWERLVEARVFPEYEQLELIRGELITLAPVRDPQLQLLRRRQAGCMRRLNRYFNLRLKSQAVVDVQSFILLWEQQSEPKPDLSLLRAREDFYATRTPKANDILLMVEVAGSSLPYDRDTKIPLYAEAGIPESWLVDLNSDTLFVYRRPSPEGYQDVRAYRRGESVAPEAFPDVSFTLEEILG
ncbi:MAG TPA: Uma2 family endonuclease [Thermoanaerobaculia bacterium]|nr:Uma2 family endonuclease [Thermoanaerobaculia bacterium]